MVKLEATQDLGSCAERRAGSSPVTRTKKFMLLCMQIGQKQSVLT